MLSSLWFTHEVHNKNPGGKNTKSRFRIYSLFKSTCCFHLPSLSVRLFAFLCREEHKVRCCIVINPSFVLAAIWSPQHAVPAKYPRGRLGFGAARREHSQWRWARLRCCRAASHARLAGLRQMWESCGRETDILEELDCCDGPLIWRWRHCSRINVPISLWVAPIAGFFMHFMIMHQVFIPQLISCTRIQMSHNHQNKVQNFGICQFWGQSIVLWLMLHCPA